MLERRHNEALLPILDQLLEQANLQAREIELIGFTAGPGSFTGIRLAAAVCQSLAFVANAEVVPLRTEEILFWAVHKQVTDADRIFCSVRSRGSLYYVCEYNQSGQIRPMTLMDEAPSWLEAPDWLENENENQNDERDCWLVGESPVWWPASMGIRKHVSAPPQAAEMIALTRRCQQQGRAVSAEAALPFYLEGDSPWKKQGEKN